MRPEHREPFLPGFFIHAVVRLLPALSAQHLVAVEVDGRHDVDPNWLRQLYAKIIRFLYAAWVCWRFLVPPTGIEPVSSA